MRKNIAPPACAFLLVTILILPAILGVSAEPIRSIGVWNNFDFSRSARDWSLAARRFGGKNALVDLVVAQADVGGLVLLPFPFQSADYLHSSVQTDEAEPYLQEFDLQGLNVILSIQPSKADVPQLLRLLLSRYGHHKSLIGVNIDLEWKQTGTPNHVSSQERDIWLREIKSHDSSFKLFLTYFEDYRSFPEDTADLVILFDGSGDTQANLLSQYKELATHYHSVGIYTGYSSSVPPTASYKRIIDAVPNTDYVIHTDDVFPNKQVLIFEMDDVQAGWLESTSIDLMNLHMRKLVPVLCGVTPRNLDNQSADGAYLPDLLKMLDKNNSDLFEVGQHGHTSQPSEQLKGKSYGEQKEIIENGLKALGSLDIEPAIFIPPFGSADEVTVKAAEDLGFEMFVDLYGGLRSEKLLILNSSLSLTETSGNTTVLKGPEQIMAEIDQKKGEKPLILLYEIGDFAIGTPSKLTQLSNILAALKNNKKYLFMTARQYLEILRNQTAPNETRLQTRDLVGLGLVMAAFIVLIARRRDIAKLARVARAELN